MDYLKDISIVKGCLSLLGSTTEADERDINYDRNNVNFHAETPKTPPQTEEMHPIMKGVEYNR